MESIKIYKGFQAPDTPAVLDYPRVMPARWQQYLTIARTFSRGSNGQLFRCRPNIALAARCSTTSSVVTHLSHVHVHTLDDARTVIGQFSPDEKKLLLDALNEPEAGKTSVRVKLTRDQIRQLFIVQMMPFVGFGILDNMILILAGEYIDQYLGSILCISTMAAAALGNILSDVAGVGLAHYVEAMVFRAGFKHPELTPEQLESSQVRITNNVARASGLVVGCLIGMFPLLFFDN
uniref:Transmembrane protein 65 n=1 Tax=Panagrellus redivivus TaxID=6233 RepID=A0A7E4UYD5_PANRE